MNRPSFKQFKKKALTKPAVRTEYEALESTFNLRKKLIKLRHSAGLTQEQIARLLNTQKSNISRLESITSKNSPKLSTIEQYADAVGYDVEISFIKRS